MTFDETLLTLLRCPTTGSALTRHGQVLRADDETYEYPLIEGVPWLLPHPRNSLLDWGAKLHHFQQVLMGEIEQLEREGKRTEGVTRERLAKMHAAKQSFLTSVIDLIRPVVTTQVAEKSLYDTLRNRAPSIQNLLSYEANLYRDWVWGDEENAQCRDIVLGEVGDLAPQRMLVLGAGSGRLAVDLHTALAPPTTLATDINPLLLLTAERVISGKTFSLYEFPHEPRRLADMAVEQTLRGLDTPPPGLHLAFADAMSSPFAPESFDLVVTPWLIDIQPFELGLFLRQLNSYLPTGGVWANFGSLVFNQSRDAYCYTVEEIEGIAQENGFELGDCRETEMPYLRSPHNAGYRMERVWSWRAEKIRHIAPAEDVQVLPEWLLDVSKPIPRTRYFQAFAQQHRVYAELTSEIDGKTSIKTIGRRMARQNRVDPNEAMEMVRNFFLEIYQQNHPV